MVELSLVHHGGAGVMRRSVDAASSRERERERVRLGERVRERERETEREREKEAISLRNNP